MLEIEGGRPMVGRSALDGQDHRITVRMPDGSTTSFMTRTPRYWRLGQRVNVIQGAYAARE